MTKLCAATIILLSVVFGLSGSVSLETATTPHEVDWTLIDQEDLEEESTESGSGESSGPEDLVAPRAESEYQWLARHRSGHIHVSDSKDVVELAEYIAAEHHRSSDESIFESHAPTQLEDGPTKLVDESDKRPRTSPLEETTSLLDDQLDEIDSTNFYPQYGVGILENGCTAFLVGPRHALTTASCVYNYTTGSWSSDLDFWRGRNGDEYLEKMLWDHAIIPANFFITGEHIYNWALIIFAEEAESPVWLKMAYSSELSDATVTMYGYFTSNHTWAKMYSTICQSDSIQDDQNCLTVQCGTSQKFNGGPILKGYNFQHSKMPLVYGISIDYGFQSNTHKAVSFHPFIFWSLCHHLTREGFDAKCGVQQQ